MSHITLYRYQAPCRHVQTRGFLFFVCRIPFFLASCTREFPMNTVKKSFNFTWALSLFGTAVGAGVLFLPINAGMGGFWPLIIMTILVGPMTYLAHRGLARFVLSSKNPGQDITYS